MQVECRSISVSIGRTYKILAVVQQSIYVVKWCQNTEYTHLDENHSA